MPRCTWILCLAVMTASAYAQPAPEQADALFRQGKALMAQQRFADACTAFESSQQLDPKLTTLLNHADCREKNGQLATAWKLFLEAERQSQAQSDAVSKQLHTVAAGRARKLEARLSRLSIEVTPDRRFAGLEISRGADPVDPGAWNQGVPIDGGTYEITARAPGRASWSATVVVKPEGDTQVVTVPALTPAVQPARSDPRQRAPRSSPRSIAAPASSGAPAARTANSVRPFSALASRAERGTRRSLALPIVIGTAALAFGGGAFAFERWAESVYDDATREPDDARQEALWKAANKRRYVAIGFSTVSIGYIGAAIYVYIRGSREVAPPIVRRSLRVEPLGSADALGLTLHRDW